MSNDGTEQGYNTDARGGSGSSYLDPTNSDVGTTATFNRSLLLDQVPLVSINGQVYLEFVLNINQKNSGGEPLLSLDNVQLSIAKVSNLGATTSSFYTTNGTYGGNATLIYDTNFDGNGDWVKLNAGLTPGAGGADMFLDVPLSDLPSDAFAGANSTLPLSSSYYVYLYSSFGGHTFTVNENTGGAANDGPEQWAAPSLGAVASNTTTTIYLGATGTTPLPSPGTAPAGSTVHDSATVSGSKGTPTGDVTFLFYSTIDATGTPVGAGTVTLDSNGVANPSAAEASLAPGSYSFVAHYNGDTTYLPSDSSVEPLTITLSTPTISTTQTPASTTVGAHISDTATVTGLVSPKTGDTVVFDLYNNSSASGTPLFSSTVTVSLSGTTATASSGSYTTLNTGTEYWVAIFNGDSNNNAVTSSAAAEPVAINPATPSLATTASPSLATLPTGPSGTVLLSDQAVLSGGFNPSGTITFTLYYNNGTTTTTVDTENVGVSGNNTYNTPTGYTLPTNGTGVTGLYYWTVAYNGDSNNTKYTEDGSTVTQEQTLASPASPTMVSTPGSTVVLGSGQPLTDSVVLSSGYYPTGTISFLLYAPGVTPDPAHDNWFYQETVSVTGNGTYHTPTGYTPTQPGTYTWQAVYSGDPNNIAPGPAAGGDGKPELQSAVGNGRILLTCPTVQDYLTILAGGTPTDGAALLNTVKFSPTSSSPVKVLSVTPTSFYYFTEFTAPKGSFTIDIQESNTYKSSYNFVIPYSNQIALYRANGTKLNLAGSIAPSTGDAVINASGLTKGATYIVGVKYSTTNIVGLAVPPTLPVHYSFVTKINGTIADANTNGLDLVDPPAPSPTSITSSSLTNLVSPVFVPSGGASSLDNGAPSIFSLWSAWESAVFAAIAAEINQLNASLTALDQLFVNWTNHSLHDLLAPDQPGNMGA